MIISRKTFVAFSVLLIALRVTSAWAQDAAGKQQVAQTPPDVPKAAIGCDGSSKLTQEKFLDMLHAIVVHGDLTDVAFVEKALGTKLVVSPINGTSSDPDERSYGSETFFRQVDSVVMKIGFNSNEHSWNQEPLERKFAYMRLSIPKDGFHDCKPLTIKQILTLLDAGFSGGEVHYNLDGSHALTVIGKDGVKVTITYTSTMPNAATLISISQRPPQQGEQK